MIDWIKLIRFIVCQQKKSSPAEYKKTDEPQPDVKEEEEKMEDQKSPGMNPAHYSALIDH